MLSRRFLYVFSGAVLAASAATASAPHFVDKRLGEEEEIRLREEWFFGQRRAGTESDEEMRALRVEAVERTREALRTQEVLQSLGFSGSQNQWYAMGPAPSTFGGWAFGPVSGRIQAIAKDWDRNILYVGAASGGVWKSTNDGLDWTSIFDTAGTVAVGAVTVDPADPDVLWVGTGDNYSSCSSYFGIGLLRSPDGGMTWETRNGEGGTSLDDLSSFSNVLVDPRSSSFITVGGRFRGCTSGNQQNGGIFTTEDGGTTWTERLAAQVHELARDPIAPDVLWAGTHSGIYKSIDNGETWVKQSGDGLPTSGTNRTEIAIAPSDPQVVYALFDGAGDSFWRTTDGGTSWTQMDDDACDGQCSYNMTLRVSATDPDRVYRGTIRLFRSDNGGASWTTLTSSWGSSQQVHQDTHSLLTHPTDPDTFYVGSDGGLWKSTNGGGSFTNRNGNLNVTQFYAIGVDAGDPDRICGGAQDNSSLARQGGSNVWALQAVTGDGFVCHIDPVQPSFAYITSYPSGGFPNVWRSSNGLFGSFNDVTGPGSGINSGDRIAWVTPYTLDPTNPATLYLGTHRLYRTDNRGSSWTQVGPPDVSGGGSQALLAVEVNRGFPDVVYTGASSNRIYRSTDGGPNLTDITGGLPDRAVTDIAGDPTNPDRAFATLSGFNAAHVWEWNAGVGWAARDSGIPNVPANSVLMLTADDILVATDTGVFRSFNGGESFVPFMAGLPQGLVAMDLKVNEAQSIVTVGTYGRGAWQVAVGPVAPMLQHGSVVQPLAELDGDGDAEIEPGETWSIRPILENVGGLAADGVSARLATSASGVEVRTAGPLGFGDLGPGDSAIVAGAYVFSVAPDVPCGETVTFDLVEIESASAGSFEDQLGIYVVSISDGNAPPVPVTVIDEDFDPAPAWAHDAPEADLDGCGSVVEIDEWKIATKDAAHGPSFHAGNGPGATYGQANFAWLRPAGRDSADDPGIEIPADALAATMTIEHWYGFAFGQDGGQVAIDAVENDLDTYTPLTPLEGYTGVLVSGGCNGLEGQNAFHGSSGGWKTSTFDLTPYRGKTIYPAFIFGSDRLAPTGEGWYIDDVRITYQAPGAPLCDISLWPGQVPEASFSLEEGQVRADWSASCNAAEFPGQTYSVQAGDLDALRDAGAYAHAALEGECDRAAGVLFAPGPGNEYYLVVPAGEGRQGSGGLDSSGTPRPNPDATCGIDRTSCP